jgi:hypothetical protein
MQMIESSALQRSAQFSTMSADDPRVLALDWILHDDELQLEANHPGLIQWYTLALLAFQFDHLTWHYDVANLTSDGTLDWLSSKHECEWYGISCRDTKVTEIDLCKYQFQISVQKVSLLKFTLILVYIGSIAFNNLVGSIAPDLCNLDSLESLILSDKTKLQHLDLAFNGLSGIVSEVSQSLVHLDLSWQSNNQDNCTTSDGRVVEPLHQMGDPENDISYGLEGKFLEQIGRLENLQYINLDHNSFDGTISQSIENLKQLGKS